MPLKSPAAMPELKAATSLAETPVSIKCNASTVLKAESLVNAALLFKAVAEVPPTMPADADTTCGAKARLLVLSMVFAKTVAEFCIDVTACACVLAGLLAGFAAALCVTSKEVTPMAANCEAALD